MTEWYNHPDPMNIPHVTRAQAAIFAQEEGIESEKPMQTQNILAFEAGTKPEFLNRKRA